MAPSARRSAHAPHWLQRIATFALEFREPACRVAGDLRQAVARSAAIAGGYCLLTGSIYFSQLGDFDRFDLVVEASCGIACIIAALDAALYFVCMKIKNDKLLEYFLCATMAIYLMDMPLSVFTYVGSIVTGPQNILPIWLTLHIALCIPQLCLMHCLLLELRGDELSTTVALLATAEHHGAVAHNDHPDGVVVAAV